MTEATWKTKDGRKIPVAQMTDLHLLNTEQFLKRKFYQMQDLSPPQFQGEMAQLTAYDEWSAMQGADVEDVFPSYADICAEVKKRGLVTFQQFSEGD
jgi:hypothetical protein